MAEQPTQYHPPQLPLEVQNLASTHQLGDPIAEYRGASFTRGGIGCIIICVVLAGFSGLLWMGAATSADPRSTLIFAAIVLSLCLALLAWVIIYHLQGRSWSVYVFNQGFVFLKGRQPDIFRLAEIRAIRQRIISSRYYSSFGLVGGLISSRRTSYIYTVERADGHSVMFDDRIKNVAELGNTLSQQISEFMLPHVLADYNAGNTVTFGRLSVNQQEMSFGRVKLPWSSIEEIKVNNGYMRVRQEGKRLSRLTLPVSVIPNFPVFMALTRHILGR